MQNQLATAKTLFEELPEQVKARFNNEMHTFLHFAENPDNLPELVDMGLAVKNERIAQALQDQDGKETPTASLSSGKSDNSDAAETVAT
jgi:phosphopentomutase